MNLNFLISSIKMQGLLELKEEKTKEEKTTKEMKEPKMKRVAIVGCRDFKDYDSLKDIIMGWQKEKGILISHIISGGARGVDALAELFAREQGLILIVKKANWNMYGRGAGPRRNTEIVAEADIVLAFPSRTSVGTWDTVRKAENAKKDCYVFNI